jgi:hypothetical protein
MKIFVESDVVNAPQSEMMYVLSCLSTPIVMEE